MIVFTKAQADAVRGESDPGHRIEPVRVDDNTYILGEEVLSDPHHAAKRDLLLACERRDLTPQELAAFAGDAP